MSMDAAFSTEAALAAGFPLEVEAGTWVENEHGDDVFVSGVVRQNVANWLGTVCPSGRTLVRAKDVVIAALEAAGVDYELV
jgi:hypothetical protein